MLRGLERKAVSASRWEAEMSWTAHCLNLREKSGIDHVVLWVCLSLVTGILGGMKDEGQLQGGVDLGGPLAPSGSIV